MISAVTVEIYLNALRSSDFLQKNETTPVFLLNPCFKSNNSNACWRQSSLHFCTHYENTAYALCTLRNDRHNAEH